MAVAVRAGIHRDTLRVMVEQGELEKISRGLYQLVGAPLPSHPDLAVVAAKVPEGVICLVSALAFHELTTQIPHEVYLAKTLADCFKFRNKIGLDTCLEALRAYRQQRRFDTDAILRFAAVCRVTNVMRPYVESVL